MLRSLRMATAAAIVCLIAVPEASALPPPSVTLQEESQVTPDARLYVGVSFPGSPLVGDDTLTTALGYQFVTYYDASYRLCLARRPLAGGSWAVITFTDANALVPASGLPADEDAHDTPNVAISVNDGRIHLAYGMHNEDLRYRMSVEDAAIVDDVDFVVGLFSAERSSLNSGGTTLPFVTYPNFVTRENNGELLMFWRETIHKEYCATYNDDGTWTAKHWVLNGQTGSGVYVDPTGVNTNSTNRRPYRGIATFGDDIHLSWIWREQNPGGAWAHHDLMFAKSTDGAATWTNTGGTSMTLPVVLGTAGSKVWDIDYDWLLFNSSSTATDNAGNTHVVMFHRENGAGTPLKYWHYNRMGNRTGNKWARSMLPASVSIFDQRPHIVVDRTYNTAYLISRVSNVVKIYASQQVANTSEVDWTKWTERYVGTTQYDYVGCPVLSDDGTTLRVIGHRKGATGGSTTSRLDILTFALDPNP